MLDFLDVALSYVARDGQPFEVISPCTFSVGSGDLVGIVGPSGVGKSTLLKALAGQLPASRGIIKLPSARWAWYAPQSPVFLDFRTTLQNALLARELGQRLSACDLALAEDLLGQIGLSQAQSLLPGEMSGGMLRRLNLAQALLSRREGLLLDEPLSELDLNTRLGVESVISRWCRQEGQTCILASHDIDSVVAIADRILVLQGPSPARVRLVPAAEWLLDKAVLPEDRRSTAGFAETVALVQRLTWEQWLA